MSQHTPARVRRTSWKWPSASPSRTPSAFMYSATAKASCSAPRARPRSWALRGRGVPPQTHISAGIDWSSRFPRTPVLDALLGQERVQLRADGVRVQAQLLRGGLRAGQMHLPQQRGPHSSLPRHTREQLVSRHLVLPSGATARTHPQVPHRGGHAAPSGVQAREDHPRVLQEHRAAGRGEIRGAES